MRTGGRRPLAAGSQRSSPGPAACRQLKPTPLLKAFALAKDAGFIWHERCSAAEKSMSERGDSRRSCSRGLQSSRRQCVLAPASVRVSPPEQEKHVCCSRHGLTACKVYTMKQGRGAEMTGKCQGNRSGGEQEQVQQQHRLQGGRQPTIHIAIHTYI